MENKVLVKFYSLELGISYDIFIPVNELIWKIKKITVKSISDLNNMPDLFNDDYFLVNKLNGRVYKSNEIVINTDIRNGTELILINKKFV